MECNGCKLGTNGRSICFIADFVGRGFFGGGSPAVVDPGGADVGMAQPLLDLGNVSVALQRAGRGRGPQGMRTQVFAGDAKALQVVLHYRGVDPPGRKGCLKAASAGIFDRPKQGAV